MNTVFLSDSSVFQSCHCILHLLSMETTSLLHSQYIAPINSWFIVALQATKPIFLSNAKETLDTNSRNKESALILTSVWYLLFHNEKIPSFKFKSKFSFHNMSIIHKLLSFVKNKFLFSLYLLIRYVWSPNEVYLYVINLLKQLEQMLMICKRKIFRTVLLSNNVLILNALDFLKRCTNII